MKRLIQFLFLLVALYLGACAYLYFNQRALVFLPSHKAPILSGENADNYIDMLVKTTDGLILHSWYHLASPGKPTILYLHGNAGDRSTRAPWMIPYIQHGYGVLMLEYRGFGANPGKPSEAGVYTDARSAMKTLKEFNVPADHVILYGESLGTGVAVQLATEYPVKAVILQSPFDSIVHVGEWRYPIFPVNALMTERFDSISKIKNVKAPILIVHGTVDKTVPFKFGKALYDAANEPKLLIPYPNRGHDDINSAQLQQDVLKFLQAVDN